MSIIRIETLLHLIARQEEEIMRLNEELLALATGFQALQAETPANDEPDTE